MVREYVDAAQLGKTRRVPPVPAHDGHADAGERRGHPIHPGDARPRGVIHHANLHAGQHPQAERDSFAHASGAAGKADHSHAGQRRHRRQPLTPRLTITPALTRRPATNCLMRWTPKRMRNRPQLARRPCSLPSLHRLHFRRRWQLKKKSSRLIGVARADPSSFSCCSCCSTRVGADVRRIGNPRLGKNFRSPRIAPGRIAATPEPASAKRQLRGTIDALGSPLAAESLANSAGSKWAFAGTDAQRATALQYGTKLLENFESDGGTFVRDSLEDAWGEYRPFANGNAPEIALSEGASEGTLLEELIHHMQVSELSPSEVADILQNNEAVQAIESTAAQDFCATLALLEFRSKI